MEEESLSVDALIDGLIEREGGYVNHPADKGGPTCFGITEAVAPGSWICRRNAQPAAVSYYQLERALIAAEGEQSRVKKAVGRGIKEWASFVLSVAAVGMAFVSPMLSVAIYVAVAAMWLIPDRRFVRD